MDNTSIETLYGQSYDTPMIINQNSIGNEFDVNMAMMVDEEDKKEHDPIVRLNVYERNSDHIGDDENLRKGLNVINHLPTVDPLDRNEGNIIVISGKSLFALYLNNLVLSFN